MNLSWIYSYLIKHFNHINNNPGTIMRIDINNVYETLMHIQQVHEKTELRRFNHNITEWIDISSNL